jgi:hypothetical protein
MKDIYSNPIQMTFEFGTVDSLSISSQNSGPKIKNCGICGICGMASENHLRRQIEFFDICKYFSK